MHELALAERILQVALDASTANGGGAILALRLKIGQLACVDPDSLRFAIDVLARDTPAAGCRVDVERVASRLRCSSCGECADRDLLDPCPSCGTRGGEVLTGREFLLDSVEVDTPAACDQPAAETARSSS